MSAYWDAIARTKKQFEASTTEHQMTVLLDNTENGTPHRHLRFAKPGTNIWSFDLVTWPGHLAISGDLQDHTFRRLHDMVDFFRGERPINPFYWGEKLVAEGQRTAYGKVDYDHDSFRERLMDWVDEWVECMDLRGEDVKGFFGAVYSELDVDHCSSDEAYRALCDFHWSCGSKEIRVYSPGEWEFGGYDHHFLLACHAIQYGVNRYLHEFPGQFFPEAILGKRLAKDGVK